MKILIFGGSSDLGKSLIPELSKFAEVITAGRSNCDIIIDLKDNADKFYLPNDIDVIIHTAAHFGGETDEDILDSVNVNVLGTIKLIQAAKRIKVKQFIYLSSIYVLSTEQKGKYSIYGITKKHSEEIIQYYAAIHSIPLVILRPSSIYGINGRFSIHQPFLYRIIESAAKGENIVIYGSNDPKRNYIFIDDLVVIVSKIIQYKLDGIYQCVYPNDITFSELAKVAFSVFNKKAFVSFDKDKPDVSDIVFDKEFTLYEKIGYYPQISINKGLEYIAKSMST
jgi:nucleoside-diphosphate-sugar epimerase